MHRFLMIAVAMVLLMLPIAVGAEDTVIPPELNWTPTPPARVMVDAEKLMDLLVKKGVITPTEYAQLTQPAVAASARQHREMDWNNAVEYATKP